MKADENKVYAIIDENGAISQTLRGETITEWDENTINIQEIPKNFKWYFVKGYKFQDGKFIEPDLATKKAIMLENFSGWAQAEIDYITQKHIPYGEQDTWAVQYDEAREFLSGAKKQSELIFLPILAQERGKDLRQLAEKVVANNKAYNEQIAKIIAQRQNLAKQVEQAKSVTLESIEWERLFMPPQSAQGVDD